MITVGLCVPYRHEMLGLVLTQKAINVHDQRIGREEMDVVIILCTLQTFAWIDKRFGFGSRYWYVLLLRCTCLLLT